VALDDGLQLGARVPGLGEDEKPTALRAHGTVLARGEPDELRATRLITFADESLPWCLGFPWYVGSSDDCEIVQTFVDVPEEILVANGPLLSFLA